MKSSMSGGLGMSFGGQIMLLNNYRKEIFRAECNPSFEAVHCFAYLDEDVSEVLPYLNAELGGENREKSEQYLSQFKLRGRGVFHPITSSLILRVERFSR